MAEACSVSQWLRESHVALDLEYALELVRDYAGCGIEKVYVEEGDGEVYTLYRGLDRLCVDEGLYCNISNDVEVEIVGRNHYVYLMDCYKLNGDATGVVKIGVSRFPQKRAKQLCEAWGRKGIRFEVRKVAKGSWSRKRTYGAEAAIHTVLRHKGLQYEANCKYDGYSELFFDREWIEKLI